jgi:DNA-binding transcriptional regulator GbsR (MarR family)
MQLEEAKERFVSEWGKLSSNWGVNKSMGQIHALLLVSPCCLTADQMMEELEMSRGNVNINLKSLIHWGLIQRENKMGCRRDYYRAEKDLWKVFQLIIEHRKRKELDPLLKLLKEMAPVKAQCEESDEFCKVLNEIDLFSKKVENGLKVMVNSDTNWLTKSLSRML